MHALLSFKGCELLALRLKLLFLRSLYDWMADATSFSFFNLLGFLELWNLGTRLLLGVSLACIPCARIVPLIALWKNIYYLQKRNDSHLSFCWSCAYISCKLLALCVCELFQKSNLFWLNVVDEENTFPFLKVKNHNIMCFWFFTKHKIQSHITGVSNDIWTSYSLL